MAVGEKVIQSLGRSHSTKSYLEKQTIDALIIVVATKRY